MWRKARLSGTAQCVGWQLEAEVETELQCRETFDSSVGTWIKAGGAGIHVNYV